MMPTSSKAFCSQLFAFLFSTSNINWTCATVVQIRVGDIYKPIKMVIDCIVVFRIGATLFLFEFQTVSPLSKGLKLVQGCRQITWKPPSVGVTERNFTFSLVLPPPALPLPPVVSSCSRPTYLFGYISKML